MAGLVQILNLTRSLPSLETLAVPAVSGLILFLAYTSQYLFYYIEPGPLSRNQALWLNALVLCIWFCYDRSCTVDPGRRGWVDRVTITTEGSEDASENQSQKEPRWCRKCDAVKPPRAHHCKTCGRCIPKMDHHCPWTTNCVSLTTFPHFIRFVLYAVISMSLLAYFLSQRLYILWENRKLPAYLGPGAWAMGHLFVLSIVNAITLFALSILLVRAIYGLAANTTMIESWEIERHEALVERSRKMGGYVYAHGGQKVRIERQEFPYDVGIWKNVCQGMGSSNPLMWFLPFGGGPSIQKSVDWEVNGFEDISKTWPPPDPDKMPRASRPSDEPKLRTFGSPEEEKAAFKLRQQQDLRRRDRGNAHAEEEAEDEYESEYEEGIDGEEGWTNSDGDRLRDYGVDEEAELLADENAPLGELLRQRKTKAG